MEPNSFYSWEIETADGDIRAQYDTDGKEQTWKTMPIDRVARVSFIPAIPILPRHDVLIDIENGEQFVRRFGRGFIRQGPDGLRLQEYLNCCVTNKYRIYVFSTGRVMATHQDMEIRV